MDWLRAENGIGRVAVDPSIGNIRLLEFRTGGRQLSPLHTAPWADDPEVTANAAFLPVEARLAGDFFCAPFADGGLDGAPAHGWSANSSWTPVSSDFGSLKLRLDRPVMGAEITKTLELAGDAPLLYQTHEMEGGAGQIPVAHHPMIRLAGRGRLSVSAKRAALAPAQPLEPGRNRLAIGVRVEDITHFPTEGGGTLDLQDLPIADRHEDFVTLVEAEGSSLGWTAVLREVEDDIVFVLKSPGCLPVTMLWHSNGGRDYAPWNGRHRGVLGVEDGCAAGAVGHRAAISPNAVSAEGVATAVTLGGKIRVAHVIGAIPRPAGWTDVKSITADHGKLDITDVAGGSLSLSFDTDFLTRES